MEETIINTPVRKQFYVTTQLSENMAKTPEGYLLCSNVPLTRTGEFLYKGTELLGEDSKPLVEPTADGIVRILRDEAEVFSETAIRSLEGKSFTISHPDGFVGPDNWQQLTHGIGQNIHRGSNGDGDLLLGDILVTTKEAIDAIEGGQREISLGYDAEYEQIAPGIGRQKGIIFNHIALVDKGRAGGRCKISDEVKACTGCGKCTCGKNKKTEDGEQEAKMTIKEQFLKFFDSLGIKDEDVKETEEEKAAREAKEKEEAEAKKTKDADDKFADLESRLKRIEDMLAELLSEENETEDEAAETEEQKAAREAKEKEEAEKKTKDEAEAKEKEEKEAAEEKEKETTDAMWPDLISHAEILVPGIALVKPTKDRLITLDAIKVEVLEKAVAGEHKKELEPILKGRDLKKMTTDTLDMAFIAASEAVAASRNGKIQTKDGSKLKVHDFATARTVAEINAFNKKFYGGQNK